MAYPCNDAKFHYKSKTYNETEFRQVLKSFDVQTASKYMDGIKSLPDMPFKKAWHELAFKKALKFATENNFDAISWDTGAIQNDRYDLQQYINRINYRKAGINNEKFSVQVFDKNDQKVQDEVLSESQLEDNYGKEIAKKITETAEKYKAKDLSGLDLSVGGEGMKGFYDKILPQFAAKYVKKWNAKVGTVEIKTGDKTETVHSISITSQMKESVLQGQPLFNKNTDVSKLTDDLNHAIKKPFGIESLKRAVIKPTGEMNEEAYVLIAHAHARAFGQTETGGWHGAFLHPGLTQRVRTALAEILANASAREGRIYGARFLKQFDKAIKENGGMIQIATSENVPNGTRETWQEETAHKHDFFTGDEHDVSRTIFPRDEIGREAMDNLRTGSYADASDSLLATEVGAKIRRDDAERELGISQEKVDYLRKLQVAEFRRRGVTKRTLVKIAREIKYAGETDAETTKRTDDEGTRKLDEGNDRAGTGEVYQRIRESGRSPDLLSASRFKQQETAQNRQNQVLTKAEPADLANTEKFLESFDLAPLYAKASPGEKNALATIFAPIWKGNRETPITEIVTNFRRAGLLTGVKTHLKNMTSNTLMQASEEASRPLAVLADIAASAVTGQRTIQTLSVPGLIKSFGALVRQDATFKSLDKESGVARAWNIIKNGDIKELDKNQLREMKSGSPLIDAMVNYTFRILGAEDALFKTYAIRRSLEESAKTLAITEAREQLGFKANPVARAKWIKNRRDELLKIPTNEMLLEAELYADFTTFTNDNPVSDTLTKFKEVNSYAKFAIETLVPYDKTPTNVIARTLEYTPLGLGWAGKHLYDLRKSESYIFTKMRKTREREQKELDANRKGARLRANDWFDEKIKIASTAAEKTRLVQRYDILKKKRNLKDVDRQIERDEIQEAMDKLFPRIAQQQFARSVGRSGLGSAALGLGIYLAMNGLLSGIWDAGEREEMKEFYERKNLGILNASLKIGNRRYVIGDTPLGKVMALGASIWERSQKPLKKGETEMSKAANDIYKVGKTTVMEQPLLNSLDDYFGSGKTAEKRIGGLLGSFVPTILADIADVRDDEARDNSHWYSGVMNRTIGARNYNEKAKNPREPYLRDETNRIINKFDPLNSRPTSTSIVLSPEQRAKKLELYRKNRAKATTDKARANWDKLIEKLEEEK